MKKGDLVLVHFPFTDLSGSKFRPALILATHRDDVILAFISTNIQNPDKFDLIIKPEAKNGLKKESAVKLAKLATLEFTLIAGRIGELDEHSMHHVNTGLKTILALK
jgi:mRNA interferase MazF